MKEISLESLPPCFEKWCLKFDNLWENKGKKTGFRCYLAGLLGESNRKNIVQITDNIVGSSYHNVHHFIGKSKWNADDVNERRLQIMNKRNQTRIRKGACHLCRQCDRVSEFSLYAIASYKNYFLVFYY